MKPAKRAIPTIAYQSAKPQSTTTTADPETIKNLYMPMWLLGGGVVIEMVSAWFQSLRPLEAFFTIGIDLILGTVIMLAGILLAARFRQIQLGNFWTAVFKLAAISVAPAALVSLASPLLNIIPLGGLLGLVAEFVLYFALLGALFDLDESDTWYCVWVIFLIRLAVYFGLAWVLRNH